MDFFFEKFKWNDEKYAAPWRGLQCDPCQSGLWENQSTQGGSGVCEYPFRNMFQTNDKKAYFEFVHI